MRLDFLPIYKRELRTLLRSPALYVMLGLYFFLSGLFFSTYIELFIQMSAEQARNPFGAQTDPINFTSFVVVDMFGVLAFLLIFIVPILTMRLLAEEKQTGTFELLATAPVSDWGIILGKFLSVATVNLLIVLLSLGYVGFMYWLGEPEGWVVVGGLIGLLIVGVSYSAFGLLASALTRSQHTAANISLVGLLVLYMIKHLLPATSGWWGDVLADASLYTHSDSLLKGVVRLEDLWFYALFTFLSLFLAHTVLKARHWKV